MNCKICGKPVEADLFIDRVKNSMLENQVCYSCHFWLEQNELDKDPERKFAIVNRTHYVLCPHTEINWPKGLGGHKYYIMFLDGRLEMCDNLWCQGNIPAEFDELIPDNAIFITEKEYQKLTENV